MHLQHKVRSRVYVILFKYSIFAHCITLLFSMCLAGNWCLNASEFNEAEQVYKNRKGQVVTIGRETWKQNNQR